MNALQIQMFLWLTNFVLTFSYFASNLTNDVRVLAFLRYSMLYADRVNSSV